MRSGLPLGRYKTRPAFGVAHKTVNSFEEHLGYAPLMHDFAGFYDAPAYAIALWAGTIADVRLVDG